MPRPHFHWLLYTLAAASMGGLLILLLRPTPIPVEVAAVSRGPLTVTLEEDGETRIHPRIIVAAPTAGRLLPLDLHAGDPLAAGQPVARMAPAPLDPRAHQRAEAALAAAEAERQATAALVAQATAAHRQARISLRRIERLAAEGHVAREELDQARTAEATAAEALAAARHREEAAVCQVEAERAVLVGADTAATTAAAASPTLTVCAPAAGRVLQVFEESEKVVAAGTPLVEVGDPKGLEVMVDVLSNEAVNIPLGAPMRIDAGGGRQLTARVRRIEPAAFTKVSPLGVEEQRVWVIGDFDTPPRGIGDRYHVEATIVLAQLEDVLRVPLGALYRDAGGWAVFTLASGRVQRQAVTIGARSLEHAEVLSGLSEGDSVVLYPPERLTPGRRVNTQTAG